MRYPTRRANRGVRGAAAAAALAIKAQARPNRAPAPATPGRRPAMTRGPRTPPVPEPATGKKTTTTTTRRELQKKPAASPPQRRQTLSPRPTTVAGRARVAALAKARRAAADRRLRLAAERAALATMPGRRLRLPPPGEGGGGGGGAEGGAEGGASGSGSGSRSGSKTPGGETLRAATVVSCDFATGACRVRFDDGDELEGVCFVGPEARRDVRWMAGRKPNREVRDALLKAAGRDAAKRMREGEKKRVGVVPGEGRFRARDASGGGDLDLSASDPDVSKRRRLAANGPPVRSPDRALASGAPPATAPGGSRPPLSRLFLDALDRAGARGLAPDELLAAMRALSDANDPRLKREKAMNAVYGVAYALRRTVAKVEDPATGRRRYARTDRETTRTCVDEAPTRKADEAPPRSVNDAPPRSVDEAPPRSDRAPPLSPRPPPPGGATAIATPEALAAPFSSSSPAGAGENLSRVPPDAVSAPGRQLLPPSSEDPPTTTLPPPAPPSPGTIPSSDELLAWSRMSHRPLHADEDGIVAACEEAWVCCDAPGCGKWRRVPAAVARRVGGTAETTPTRDPNGVGDTSWRCADGRDVRYNACAAPQELENDDIDRRVAAAERRERKRAQDRAYRARKRARREAARAGLVLEEEGEGEGGEASFAYLERRDGPLVTVLILVVEGDGTDPGRACVVLVRSPAGDRRSRRRGKIPRKFREGGLGGGEQPPKRKYRKKPPGPGGEGTPVGRVRGLRELWDAHGSTRRRGGGGPPRAKVPAGLLEAFRRHCPSAYVAALAADYPDGGGDDFPRFPILAADDLGPVRPPDLADLAARMRRLEVDVDRPRPAAEASEEDARSGLLLREALGLDREVPRHGPPGIALLTPALASANPAPPGFAYDPLDAADDMPLATLYRGEIEAAGWSSSEDEEEDEDDGGTAGAAPPPSLPGWGARGARVPRRRGDRLRRRFRDAAVRHDAAIRADASRARRSTGDEDDRGGGAPTGVVSSSAPPEKAPAAAASLLPSGLAASPGGSPPAPLAFHASLPGPLASAPFARVPAWAHPAWPLGGVGGPSEGAGGPGGGLRGGAPGRKARKLPRVWRGKDLDMIVFGRDERLEWARKTGMFLGRARRALGDRRLRRDAWGGSVLDSVVGAMLTQNVSDVLSSTAIMNLAAKFPPKRDDDPERDEPGDEAAGGDERTRDERTRDERTRDEEPRGRTPSEDARNARESPEREEEHPTLMPAPTTPAPPPPAPPPLPGDRASPGLVTAANAANAYFAERARLGESEEAGASPPPRPPAAPAPAAVPTEADAFASPGPRGSAPAAPPTPAETGARGPPPPPPPPPPPAPAPPPPRDPFGDATPAAAMDTAADGAEADPAPPPPPPPPRGAGTGAGDPPDARRESAPGRLLSVSGANPIPIPPPDPPADPSTPPPPSGAPPPPLGAGAGRKIPKHARVREERLALARLALATPDPTPRPRATRDLIDWRAVMEAPEEEVVECIRCRGMHFLLAGRIQRLLRRVLAERDGALSLEFLRDCPTELARGYLLSLEGFGVKTVSCILLLALYRADFPVDVNVGRIMARLGWVPLETEEALEELSVYAPEPAVYTFLRERLNAFGLQTLFELHYHMITLGKVFCEKRTPNCAACPLRDMCEYARSGGKRQKGVQGGEGDQKNDELASARKGPETTTPRGEAPMHESGGTTTTRASPGNEATTGGPRRSGDAADGEPLLGVDRGGCSRFAALPPAEALEKILDAGAAWDAGGRPAPGAGAVLGIDPGADWATARAAHAKLSRVAHPDKCADPRAARAFALITAARNAFAPAAPDDDDDEDDERVEDVEDAFATSPTQPPGAPNPLPPPPPPLSSGFAAAARTHFASMEASPLQIRVRPSSRTNLGRFRHEMDAWSLPPEHVPARLTRRAPGIDADAYLAVRCGHASARRVAEDAAERDPERREFVPVSVLVPCRAAMRGSFPLHGTYFQTNEVFLDAHTAAVPALVPRTALDRRPIVTVFLGASVHSITRGMSRAEVVDAFANRAVCVRAIDADPGAAPGGGTPRPLPRWACPFLPRGAATARPAPGEEDEDDGGGAVGRVGRHARAAALAPGQPAAAADPADPVDMDEEWDRFVGFPRGSGTPEGFERASAEGSRATGSLRERSRDAVGGEWNSVVFAAYAARRKAAEAARAGAARGAAEAGAGARGRKEAAGSGSADIATFFAPASGAA